MEAGNADAVDPPGVDTDHDDDDPRRELDSEAEVEWNGDFVGDLEPARGDDENTRQCSAAEAKTTP